MRKLVFAGHKKRGGEIIKLLEMLGGKNIIGFKKTFVGFYYWINENNEITASDMPPANSMVYLLEDFEKEFPYKVGDKVTLDNKLCTIMWMCWECDKMYYQVQEANGMFTKKVAVDELKPYKEEKTFPPYMDYDIKTTKEQETMECSDKRHKGNCTIGYIQELGSKDMELIIPYNQEIVIENGRYILRDKKPKYPTTYAECCKIVNAAIFVSLVYDITDGEGYSHDVDNLKIYDNIRRLKICRDAYWKIAGEQMGLDKPYEPKHEYDEEIFFIFCDRVNGINKGQGFPTDNFCLVFPTKEMRDAFYNNFKDLIENCKELL